MNNKYFFFQLIALLFVARGALAAERLVIDPIGFNQKSTFLYMAKDPSCTCKNNQCYFEDESGKNECFPQYTMSVDLVTDKIVTLTEEQIKVMKIIGPRPKLESFPIEHSADSFSVSLGTDCNRDYESFTSDKKSPKCEVFLISKKQGKKKVADFTFSPSPNHSVTVLGYYKHPSEPKIAVILVEKSYHFEGELDSYQKVIGADLTKGFKK
jgi:hypothetical protein